MKKLWGLILFSIWLLLASCSQPEAATTTDAFETDPYIYYVTALETVVFSAKYPREWQAFGSGSGALFSNSQTFIESGLIEELGDSAAIVLETAGTAAFGSGTPVEILAALLQQQNDLERATAASPLTIAGYPAATAIAHRLDNETDYLVIFTFIIVDERIILLLSTAPSAAQTEIADINQTFVNSIQIHALQEINYIDQEISYGQGVRAVAQPGELTGIYFNGSAGEVVDLAVSPTDEDAKLTISILGSEGSPITATRFGGVTAVQGLELPETTPYFVAVANVGSQATEIQFLVKLADE